MAWVVPRRPILHTSRTVSGASESSLGLGNLGLGHLSLSVDVDVPSELWPGDIALGKNSCSISFSFSPVPVEKF